MSTLLAAQVQAPEIDYKELSPLFAVAGGSVIVLLVGLFRSFFVRSARGARARRDLAAHGDRPDDLDLGARQPRADRRGRAERRRALARHLDALLRGRARDDRCCRCARPPTLEAGHGEYYSLLLGSIAGMVVLAEAESLMTLFIGFELLSIPLYVLCATHLRRRTSLESGLKYLVVGSVGSATLLYGLALIYGATGALRFDGDRRRARRRRAERRRPAPPHRHRARRHRARVQGVGGALPPVDARRLRGRAHADHDLHGGGHQGGRVRDPAAPVRPRTRARRSSTGGPALAVLAATTIVVGQRRRDRAALAEADAGLVERRAGRLPARRRRRRAPSSACARRRSTWPSTC